MFPKVKHWALVGAGRSAAHNLEKIKRAGVDAVAIVNGVAKWYPSPDVFFVFDTLAKKLYGEYARELEATGGLICTHKDNRSVRFPYVPSYRFGDKLRPTRQRIAHGTCVSIIALQVLFRMGAHRVSLCGMDGYDLPYITAARPEWPLWKREKWLRRKQRIYTVVLGRVSKVWDDREIHWYGPSRTRAASGLWTIHN